MSDQEIPDEAPEQTEVFEQYDEAADDAEVDPSAAGVTGAERDLTRATELPVDSAANDELGAGLDDPEAMAVLSGGMDDPDGLGAEGLVPDGSGPAEDGGWDLDAGER